MSMSGLLTFKQSPLAFVVGLDVVKVVSDYENGWQRILERACDSFEFRSRCSLCVSSEWSVSDLYDNGQLFFHLFCVFALFTCSVAPIVVFAPLCAFVPLVAAFGAFALPPICPFSSALLR